MQPTVPTPLVARLRREVGLLRRRESRRRFDVVVHVGRPGDGGLDAFVVRAQDVPAIDVGLRVEVVVAMLEQSGPVDAVWLTRPGMPSPHDVDLDWLSASDAAAGVLGHDPPGFYAITRYGWLDVRTGDSRVWKRLRI